MKKEKEAPALNAGSLADVAFLLLIFFLVTTTIQTDAGIPTLLPPWIEGTNCTPIHKDNILAIEINGQDQLRIQDQELPIEAIEAAVRALLYERAKTPKKALVQLKNSAHTSYARYIQVQSTIRAAYHGVWEEQAQNQYGRSYEDLEPAVQRIIRKQYPYVLAEHQASAVME